MKGISRLGWTAYVVALLVILADQGSKYWVLEVFQLPLRPSTQVAGPLSLTMVWNQGVSFGLLWANHDIVRWALAAFSIAVSVMLAVWVRRAERPLMAWALAFIMGGALGNVIDRIRFGAVADFIDVSALGFFPWVFNVADAAINIGIGLLLIDMLTTERRQKRAKQAAS
ncbi:signal peptidase II [Phenylobacterium sp.]|jgi:signal peptidase II|uniref:signal peptidase II n=1 Tax=Phenylobacterium sp. TaxID=1871053 RepID=UPI002F924282